MNGLGFLAFLGGGTFGFVRLIIVFALICLAVSLIIKFWWVVAIIVVASVITLAIKRYLAPKG